ncbi:MAG: phosphatase PAP2 family protein [Clostridia bacterium]|nr:phosphatase PAP2 family protein [Clostridia bacterium]
MDVFLPFDFAVLDWIAENLRCGFMDFIMPLITRLGDEGIFWIATALILLIFPKTRKTGAMMGVAMLLGLLIGNKCLKPLIARTRPYDVREILPYLIEPESSKSFPSGHTLVCFEAATVLMIRHAKPWGIAALVAAFLVAFSRMYLFVHYPTDILGGIILGTLFGFCGVWIVNGFMKLIKKN